MASKWWKKSVVYQIYPKSFNDSNGDGIGDLNGITEKLDYLKDLGVDVIWICPMYCSPMDDNGYDISNYYEVNPIFGTNEDMEKLIDEAQKRNIKIILDLVVNHCSDEHEWFKRAVDDPNSEEAGYFYFQTGDSEPNNWRSNFGGSVWSKLPDGRWYYHTFSKRQPDLNWENPKLREKVYEMVNWWLDKGIAGFRIDAITFIKKDLTFESRKTEDGLRYPIENLTDYPGIGEFLTELKEKCFDKYDCMTVAEAPGVGDETFKRYAGEQGYFSMIFDFSWENMENEENKAAVDAVERLKERIFRTQEFTESLGWNAVFLENHDQSRCVNKYLEDVDISFESASALGTMYFFLRGTPFIYEGQEIGMTNVQWNSIDEMDDVRAKGKYKEALDQNQDAKEVFEYFSRLGRDNSRTPMQWSADVNAGFTSGKPWIKINENYKDINVDVQNRDSLSLLSYYKKLTRLHHHPIYEDVFAEGSFKQIFKEMPAIMAYERAFNEQTITVVVNFKHDYQEIKADNQPVLLNNYDDLVYEGDRFWLKPYQAVVFSGKL